MRITIALLLVGCTVTTPPVPAPVVVPPRDSGHPIDAGIPDAGGASACAHLAELGCTTWVPADGGIAACEMGLSNLAESGIKVDAACLTAIMSCDAAGRCSK